MSVTELKLNAFMRPLHYWSRSAHYMQYFWVQQESTIYLKVISTVALSVSIGPAVYLCSFCPLRFLFYGPKAESVMVVLHYYWYTVFRDML